MQFYIIGEREIVLAFRLAGVLGKVAENRHDVLSEFNKITGIRDGVSSPLPSEETPKVLILTEAAAHMIEQEEIQWQKTGKYPLIVEVPGLEGPVKGKKSLSDAIREAIGVSV